MRRTLAFPFAAGLLQLAVCNPAQAQDITPAEAHRLATESKAVLIDIRRPDEWADTGVARGAVRIDMEDPLFLAKLAAATGGDRARPVALICRTANRTRVVQQALRQRGYAEVLNVEGGMIGNTADRGWIARGLPVEK